MLAGVERRTGRNGEDRGRRSRAVRIAGAAAASIPRPWSRTWQIDPLKAAAFLVGAGLVVLLGFSGGGFFPQAWTWATIVLGWVAATALLLRKRLDATWIDAAFVAGLAGLAGWMLLSAVWSMDAGQSLLEARRMLLYLTAAVALLVVLERRSVPHLLAGVFVGVVGVSTFGLGWFLLDPGSLSRDPLEAGLLTQPVGYANAFGILTAIGIVLGLAFGARGASPHRRALATASLVPLAAAIALTSSRGSWLALGVGLGVTFLVDWRRAELLAVAAAAAPSAAVAVLLVEGWGRPGAGAAAGVVACTVAAGAARAALPRVAVLVRRFGRPRLLAALAAAAAIAAVAGVAAQRTDWSVDLSDRGYYWRAAWHDHQSHPWLGSGAGTVSYYSRRPGPELPATDAHSLYLESLAELGPVGLALVVAALALPLAAAAVARRRSFVAPALGAYLAYLVHAGFDWDWEMPVVTLAGMSCGVVLLAEARACARGRLPSFRARLSSLPRQFWREGRA
jgi:hypothetical protein